MVAVGDKIAGRYTLRKQLGSGGMGIVWLALDSDLDREVALKCPQLGDKLGAKRLRTEARNAARLRHPHIVAVYDVFDEATNCWLVLEYVKARSLAEIVRENGTVKPQRAATIGWQIADALAVAHAHGVVHSDVTPENILVTDEGIAKLTDFGISRSLWSDVTQTDSATVRGKLPYLAPEVARGQQAGRESDMFSLGATLFAAIEGRSPFGDVEHPAALLTKAAAGDVDPPRKAGGLTAPLTQLLLPDPKRRPAAAEATELFKEISPPDRKVLELDDRWRATATPPEFERRRRRRRFALGAGALVVVAATVAGIVFFSPSRTAPAAQPPVVIGDAHTVDPCALVATASLAQFGEIDLSTDSGNFDRCDLLVHPHGQVIGDVKAALGNGAPAPDSQVQTKRVGDVTVLLEPVDGDTCDRTLALADGNQVGITGRKDDPTGPDPCALADAATDYAVGVLNRGPIPRRAAPLPAESLALADACGLVDASALSSVPGVDALHPEAGFGNWSCRWNSTTDNGGVDLTFDRNPPLTAGDGQPMALRGRQSFMTPEFDGPDDCTVRVEYRAYTSITGEAMVELIMVKVLGSQPSAQRCATAKTLATAAVTGVEAKLPR